MGGYYAGRYRSDAWWEDGGGNDEYWNKYCSACGTTTDHDGSGCAECHNRALRRRDRVRSVEVPASNGDTHTVKVYPNGARYCSCKGFKFRKSCKHTSQA